MDESTGVLVRRVKGGDAAAVEALLQKALPPLRRWARGRLPRYARDVMDTEDVVQDAVMGTLQRIGDFEPTRKGSFQAYLRTAVKNKIRDEMRRLARRGHSEALTESHGDGAPSPLEVAIGHQAVERYERALDLLRPEERVAVIFRVELQYSFDDLADVLEKPSADAARMAVNRALEKLSAYMQISH